MILLKYIFLLFPVGIYTFQWSLDMPAGPYIILERTEHNFGLIKSPWKQRCTFTLANIGNDTLYIKNVEVACGCTQPFFTKRGIAPGHSDSVWVDVDPRLLSEDFDRELYIISNASNGQQTITVSGVSRPPFR
jgi:hypothetical protein